MGKKKKEEKWEKTNVMRILDAAKLSYEAREYPVDENDLSGSHAADLLGVPHESVYKTLVLKGEKTGYLVCCIPVDEELDLKKAAKAAGDKKVEMLAMKDLLAVTGYIRGGCSPVGMKKKFPTYIEERVSGQEKIALSAGQRGRQILVEPKEILPFLGAKRADLCSDFAEKK
ncbi:MAG: Cys-tRNA(Pro) deacylase [bacterium]|nr:Cys-tRNA(Pro) deacylase [bacterium]